MGQISGRRSYMKVKGTQRGDAGGKGTGGFSLIDLFSGCGGFSLGMEWAGFNCRAAIDFEKAAIDTFEANHKRVPHALCRDLTKFSPEELDALLGGEAIDVIVGGPPCQGFSKARKADGANHGENLVPDARRELYKEFLRYVEFYRPKVFVMENVPGLKTAAGGKFFTQVQVEIRALGYRVIPYEVETWRFGVPQKRVRQLLIGTRLELPMFIPEKYIKPTHTLCADETGRLQPAVTLGEAIGDLPKIEAGDEQFFRKYNHSLRRKHIAQYGDRFTKDVLQAHQATMLTSHTARPHSQRDLRDFGRLREGENSREALARGEVMEFPYDRENFKDRYTRQHRDELCSTIVAHLKKDGLMFIHPTQLRSLTPREAARVQSFPDTFMLPESRTPAFNQVGNAVPPLVGKAVGLGIVEYLADAAARQDAEPAEIRAPLDLAAVIEDLEDFVESLFLRPVSNLSKEDFLAAWGTVCYLHPTLHPDAALDNGRELSLGPKREVSFVMEPIYVRSGWPVELIPLAKEARRRFDAGQLREHEYYWSPTLFSGLQETKPRVEKIV
jgi:DNA (cytosine-5)-methyltransferase 1